MASDSDTYDAMNGGGGGGATVVYLGSYGNANRIALAGGGGGGSSQWKDAKRKCSSSWGANGANAGTKTTAGKGTGPSVTGSTYRNTPGTYGSLTKDILQGASSSLYGGGDGGGVWGTQSTKRFCSGNGGLSAASSTYNGVAAGPDDAGFVEMEVPAGYTKGDGLFRLTKIS